MVYMGSKRKYCKDIVPIIQNYIDKNKIKTFIDCFCGGANLVDKIKCETLIASDLSPSLIALHKQAQKDFSQIPIEGSREYWDKAYADWKQMKKNMEDPQCEDFAYNLSLPLYEIGAIEWYGSFSNGGFPRGYARPSAGRDYYKEAYRNHKNQAENENYKKIKFMNMDYKQAIQQTRVNNFNIAIYCDSPYKGTKPYAINNKFDFEEYYKWLRNVSQIYPVFVSEQYLPEDFDEFIIWSKDAKRTCGLDNNYKAVETLWLIDRRG